MTNEEDMEKKKGSMIFSLVSYVSINCIRFTGMISAQSTPTNNGVQSIYFAEEGQGDCNISTRRRSEATASKPRRFVLGDYVSTHSHPKVAAEWIAEFGDEQPFQHTAARRRLLTPIVKRFCTLHVSTHSRTKAAACSCKHHWAKLRGFNTQPHEGGCSNLKGFRYQIRCFNTQPHEGGCKSI